MANKKNIILSIDPADYHITREQIAELATEFYGFDLEFSGSEGEKMDIAFQSQKIENVEEKLNEVLDEKSLISSFTKALESFKVAKQ